MTGARDPLGKRALYWMPVERLVEGDAAGPRGDHHGTQAGNPTAGGAHRHDRPAGRHALFASAAPGEGEDVATAIDPLPPRGRLTLACSSCDSVSRVGVIEFALLHLPFCMWMPRRTFDRWITCPACRRHTWMSVTLSR